MNTKRYSHQSQSFEWLKWATLMLEIALDPWGQWGLGRSAHGSEGFSIPSTI